MSAVSTLRRFTPPWLQRTHGARFLEGCADVVDQLTERTIQSVKIRFPGAPPRAPDPAALALTGRERRIRRGPSESDSVYAGRLQGWWDAHRTRGGPYALLSQMYAYFRDYARVPTAVVYHSGTRLSMDVAGDVTRDTIVWNADGTDQWARIWIFFDVSGVGGAGILTTEGGDVITTEDGDPLGIVVGSIVDLTTGTATAEVEDIFRAIPRDWTAAHINRTTLVLLYDPLIDLWGYPPGVLWGAAGDVWQETDPVEIVIDAG